MALVEASRSSFPVSRRRLSRSIGQRNGIASPKRSPASSPALPPLMAQFHYRSSYHYDPTPPPSAQNPSSFPLSRETRRRSPAVGHRHDHAPLRVPRAEQRGPSSPVSPAWASHAPPDDAPQDASSPPPRKPENGASTERCRLPSAVAAAAEATRLSRGAARTARFVVGTTKKPTTEKPNVADLRARLRSRCRSRCATPPTFISRLSDRLPSRRHSGGASCRSRIG